MTKLPCWSCFGGGLKRSDRTEVGAFVAMKSFNAAWSNDSPSADRRSERATRELLLGAGEAFAVDPLPERDLVDESGFAPSFDVRGFFFCDSRH